METCNNCLKELSGGFKYYYELLKANGEKEYYCSAKCLSSIPYEEDTSIDYVEIPGYKESKDDFVF